MIGLRIARGIGNLLLQEVTRDRHQCHRDNRHQREPARDIGDHAHEQDQERHVDDQHDRGRGKEIAHGGVFAHPGGQCAGVPLTRREGQPHYAAEQLLRELDIETATDFIDHIGPRSAQREFHRKCQQDADTKHPKGTHRAVRYHPVIHIHREQRQRKRQQVDD